jgi:hypothetical protein
LGLALLLIFIIFPYLNIDWEVAKKIKSLGSLTIISLAVLAGIVYLGIAYLLQKSKLPRQINKLNFDYLVIGFFVFFTIFFTALAFQRYLNFNTGILDFGLEHQVINNTANGNLFGASVEVNNYLGDHFSLLILPLAFIYKIFPNVLTIFLVQTLCVTIGGLGIYMISKKVIQNKAISFLFFMSFIFFIGNSGILLFDFHPVSLGVPFYLMNVMSEHEGQFSAINQYDTVTTLVVFLAAIFAVRLILNRSSAELRFQTLILISALIGFFFLAFLPTHRMMNVLLDKSDYSSQNEVISNIKKDLDKNLIIRASNGIGGHFGEFPHLQILDESFKIYSQLPDVIIVDRFPISVGTYESILPKLLEKGYVQTFGSEWVDVYSAIRFPFVYLNLYLEFFRASLSVLSDISPQGRGTSLLSCLNCRLSAVNCQPNLHFSLI